jgi:hypothetical protein
MLRSSIGLLLASTMSLFSSSPARGLEVAVRFPTSVSSEPLDGRLLLLIAVKGDPEPRFQVRGRVDSAQVFGQDVNGMKADHAVVFDSSVFGWPIENLQSLPAGEYVVQALLHRYETFRPSHGHTIQLPMDRGEGQQWSKAPGNLFSTPQTMRLDPAAGGRIELVLDQVIPPIEPPKDTRYVRHVKIQSDRLSEFWGRPMFLGAHVLLPEGFDEHPDVRYPLCIFHGHFPPDFGGFREEPPDPDLVPDYSERFDLHGYNRIVQQEAHAFYETWKKPDFPRFLIVEIQHANPYYDDSYAVNSANLGPYGDAIMYELLPAIEKQFRGIGAGWARFLYGGSTGGWEALAAQIFYPDEFNGCFAACPDPIDFRAYCQVNVYEDTNAYTLQGPFERLLRPAYRNWLGKVTATVEGMNHLELALATHGRSGEQFDIWQAVFSPLGPDGYPKPIWDKLTGKIDPEVAAHWRENYDLRHILQRDWQKLAPKLAGKIHIYCGDMDNYYLNNAVYLMEDFLASTVPPYGGEVDYGDRAEHCWNGDHENPNAISRLRYNTFYVPKILARIAESAPPGADLTSWRY